MNQTIVERQRSAVRAVPTRPAFYSRFFKRAFDLIISLFLAPIVLLVVGICCLIIKRDGGPGLYSQTRIGRNGESFKCWKIRTMIVDADSKLEELFKSDEAARLEWERDQKLKNDPRITKFGTLLRKTSLDELPQLWNVLIGDMSLVGPRPFMANQKDIYDSCGTHTSYYSVRPGVTGLWQVKDRNNATFKSRFKFDNEYVLGLSFVNDVKILLATVFVVLKRTGH